MSIYHEKYVELQRLRNARPIDVTPSRTALLIIDMQEYFLNPDSPHSQSATSLAPDMADVNDHFYEQGRNVVEPTLQRLASFFRKHGLRVIWTTCSSELDDGGDLIPALKSANAASRELGCDWFIPPKSSEWARFVSTIEPLPDELVINKTSFSAFAGTGLEQTLHNMGITTLVIGGLVTNYCVEATARDGVGLGFEVILVDDACACRSPEMQAATMLTFGGSQGRVRQADEVITLLEQSL